LFATFQSDSAEEEGRRRRRRRGGGGGGEAKKARLAEVMSMHNSRQLEGPSAAATILVY
jgi:hypothetical protein